MYQIQAATNILAEAQKILEDSQTLMTCQNNDQCPDVASTITQAFDEFIVKGDYCCPIISSCCEFNDYFFANLEALSYSFGGPVIFGFIVAALLLTIVLMCCCCCCCCCCRKSTAGVGFSSA
ncbi:uncharacterized protein LOC134856322 [Symsagittifera roscoffensis]|uniref:uncharacterized protein LOC134856322 n=1 Tax=Symsagittifera roscoffensis TaxID=84072 RepID=UPI00307C611E